MSDDTTAKLEAERAAKYMDHVAALEAPGEVIRSRRRPLDP